LIYAGVLIRTPIGHVDQGVGCDRVSKLERFASFPIPYRSLFTRHQSAHPHNSKVNVSFTLRHHQGNFAMTSSWYLAS
jgi:hypothetical protein